MIKFLKSTIWFILPGLLLFNCGDDPLDPLDTRNFQLNTYMKGYHAKNFPSTESKKEGKPSVYVDLSSGLSWGFKDGSGNKEIVKQIAGVLKEGHFWYKVQNSQTMLVEVK